MKTEFYAGLGMHNKLIKTLEGVIVPFMTDEAVIDIDNTVYRVLSYGLIINGDGITAHIRLK